MNISPNFCMDIRTFCFPLPKIVEVAYGPVWSNQVVLEGRGSIRCSSPETALQIGSKLTSIEHCTYPVEEGSKLAIDASILLGCTWGYVLEVNSQPFLFAGLFEGLIFSCIIAMEALYLQIVLSF